MSLEPTPSAKRHPRPSMRPRVRNRVATPLPAPSVKPPPSLIPADVLRDIEEVRSSDLLLEPRTAPEAMGEPAVATSLPADPSVAQYALRQVALFKSLSAAAVAQLVPGSLQVNVPAGEYLFSEGDAADSFFIVLDGTFELLRREGGREVALRHDSNGAAIGLFGLFTTQMRSASARAIGDATVIEVRGERLQHLLDTNADLHDRMLKFFRQRVVEVFVSGKLFSDVDSIARARVIGRFANRSLEAGEALVSPGEVANMIAVVTHGSLTVEERSRVGTAPKHFEVGPGQFVAVTAALTGQPCRMKVFASDFATVELLSHRELMELMKDYPAFRALPAKLISLARPLDRDVFCGSTGVTGL